MKPKRLLDSSRAAVGQVFEMQPAAVTSRGWHNARVKVIAHSVERSRLKVKLIGFAPNIDRSFTRPPLGREVTLDITEHTLTYTGGFGAWFRATGGGATCAR